MTTVIASSDCMVRLSVQVHMFILYVVHTHACNHYISMYAYPNAYSGTFIWMSTCLPCMRDQLWVLPFNFVNKLIEEHEPVRYHLRKVRAPSRNLNTACMSARESTVAKYTDRDACMKLRCSDIYAYTYTGGTPKDSVPPRTFRHPQSREKRFVTCVCVRIYASTFPFHQ